jgi:predicted amidohydrolase YtcJ
VTGSHLKYGVLPGSTGSLEADGPRQCLDAILPDRPVAVMAYDYHTLWANTRALELAGILQGGETGPNSEIVIGLDGLANGELREPAAYGKVLALTGVWGRAAGGLVGESDAAIDTETLVQDRTILRQGLALAAKAGITSVHNMDGNLRQAGLYAALEDLGELTVRVYIPYSVKPETMPQDLDEAIAMRTQFPGSSACAGTHLVHAGLAKFFMDGVMESWTALLLDDYADRPGWKGDALYSLEHFTRMAAECDRRGLQIAVHAIGDGAVRRTLDGFEAVQRLNGVRDRRHRIEHIELVHPDDAPRFARLGVIASMQPLHAPTAAYGDDIWPLRAGEARWGRSFAWQMLRQAGARLIFGSDWPVVRPYPMHALFAALGRQPWKPGQPEQRQALDDIIAAYTRDAAYAEFQEHCKGMLRPGLLADLVLLSGNLEAAASGVGEPAASSRETDLQSIEPVLTICDGRIVYERSD